jgi:magnesium-transporting ATPase (P-type)
MLREAHVGVSIIGNEEGLAVASSDFAIGRFRFLLNLLFVHGRTNYKRMALILNYTIFKNVCLVVPNFHFNLVNGFSAASLYESWILISYNLWWTSVPIILAGVIEEDLPPICALHFPFLYHEGRNSIGFNVKVS